MKNKKKTTPEKGEVSKAKTSFDQTVKEKEEGKKKKEKIQKAVGLKDQKVDQVEATENNEAGFHFVVDAEQAAENALLDNGGVNKGYKIARREYKDDKGKVKDAKFFYTLTIEEGKEKGRFEDNTQGFASKESAMKAAEKALKVDHEINFNKRMGRYFYKLTMDGKKVVPATKVADKKKANKKDDKTAGQKAKVLPKTGAVAGSVAMLGLALATAGSAFTFRRKK
ncbi:LPXTG cell wall anchor domain-containing protein [Aerococcus christensenii]|uniref:LPXTG cell wall anchor domain-containing protein n=1 Tax=Aerococcus christensenii TaxID=87541 RepID=UPI003F430B98